MILCTKTFIDSLISEFGKRDVKLNVDASFYAFAHKFFNKKYLA
jgi:hypothetical protein